MTRRRTYLLWDWNGTLLDDTAASVAALNEQLTARNLPPIDIAFYRDHFAFPVRTFYSACGIALEKENWAALAESYHAAYLRQPRRLNRQTLAVLARVRGSGCGQSIISALRQDLLERDVSAFGVDVWMDHVYGTDNLDGASKTARAAELLACLAREGVSAADCVLIGDSLHDKDVADRLGVRCVLCAQGGHAAWRLRAAAPTAETLDEAVTLAFAR
jgi:phosphoglycolate phosphatase